MATVTTKFWQDLLEIHDQGDAIIAIVDTNFVLRAASDRAQEVFALPLEEVIDRSVTDLIHDGDLERALRAFEQTSAYEGLRPPDVYRIKQGPETYRPYDVTGERVLDGGAVVFRLNELTDRRRAEILAIEQIEVLEMMSAGRSRADCLAALANLCERHVEGGLAIVHVPSTDGVLEPITTGRIRNCVRNRYANLPIDQPGGNLGEAGRRGLSVVELDIASLDHWADVAGSLAQSGYVTCITTPALSPAGQLVGYLEVLRQTDVRPDNAELSVHALVARLVGLILDRMSFEAALSEAAFTDELTGLGNRRQLGDHLLALADNDEPFGLLGIDLDQFAWINNNLGHAAGDDLLVEVSRRISAALPAEAQAFRPGGDEFVVVVQRERRSEDLLAIAKNLLAVVREPMRLANTERRVNASIGISKSRGEADPERVIARADAAMYAAKREGGAGVRLFSEPIGQEMMRRMSLADELRGAIEQQQLRLVYQPVIQLGTRELVGVEALVRWEHPLHGLIGPDEFVPIAEESTLILELDEWVLNRAAEQLVGWSAGRSPLQSFEMWVNLSARSFMRPDLRRLLDELPQPSGTAKLGLELTERDPIDDLEGAIRSFERLRADGVPVAIDDFGTGRASLQRVADFEPSNIKVDRSFVSRLTESGKYRTVIESIIDIARRFDLTVTAEGVERPEEVALLEELGCDQAQGFYFGRPMVANALEHRFGRSIDRPWHPLTDERTG